MQETRIDLDDLDKRLLALLQRNAHLTAQELGDELNLSASQAGRRRQRLEAEGLITSYAARLDPSRLGLAVQAFVQVQMTRHGAETTAAFARLIGLQPEIVSAWTLTGEADLTTPQRAVGFFLESAREGDFLRAAGVVFAEPHAFPVPFVAKQHTSLTFTELPDAGSISIFTVDGDKVIELQIPAGAGILQWNVKNSGGKNVASGVYLFLVEGSDGSKTEGKIVVIR